MVLATLWTRTIWAPFKMEADTTAWVPVSTSGASAKNSFVKCFFNSISDKGFSGRAYKNGNA
jgi:hypothetical protein